MKSLAALISVLLSVYGHSIAQPLIINEISPANSSVLSDQDGDFVDWIEFYNNSDDFISIKGMGISDDPSLIKFKIPQVYLDPRTYFTVFASDKNLSWWVTQWETIVTKGDEWKWVYGSSLISESWKTKIFFDLDWNNGKSGIGYGDGDDSTLVNTAISLFARKTFTISSLDEINSFVLNVDADDGFVAYLNGKELCRSNMGEPGSIVTWNQFADQSVEAVEYQNGYPAKFIFRNPADWLQIGINTLAIEVHNAENGMDDLTLIPYFTLGLTEFPPEGKGAPLYLNLPGFELHTNFKLNSDSDGVYLFDAAGVLVDQQIFKNVPADISWGRQNNGTWAYFKTPTPGFENAGEVASFQLSTPKIDIKGGFFTSPQTISVSSANPQEIIRFTKDGSVPTGSSEIYSGPILVSQNSTLRFKSFFPGALDGKTSTQTYFFNEPRNLPVVSLVTDSLWLFSADSGIYVPGPNPGEFPYWGANFWLDKEIPAHFEYFDESGIRQVSVNTGVVIYGSYSRTFPQKSIALYTRSRYGDPSFNFPFFSDKKADTYEALILRNSGQDVESTMLRDGFNNRLIKDFRVDYQAHKQVAVYINGKYWGIHNLREKSNKDYFFDNYQVVEEDLQLLEEMGWATVGDSSGYTDMLEWIEANPLTSDQNYQVITNQIDVGNFIDYNIAEIFAANWDWPGNNVKYWRRINPTSKWRWLVYGTDFGFSLLSEVQADHNTLAFARADNVVEGPNPAWSTWLFRKMLESESFKWEFVNTFCDRMNSVYLPSNSKKELAASADEIRAEIPRHIQRWNEISGSWEGNLAKIEQFLDVRPGFMFRYIKEGFNLSDTVRISIENPDTVAGKITVNILKVKTKNWSGLYYPEVPVTLTAIPKTGFRFVGWQGSINSSNPVLVVNPAMGMTFTAVFEKVTGSLPQLVINEINYNSDAAFPVEDWVEITNTGSESADLTGYIFKDSEDAHQAVFPAGTVLAPGDFIVLVRDTMKFDAGFPEVLNRLGILSFGLDKNGEKIRLFSNDNRIVDSLTYNQKAPWPIEPDGKGAALALKDPKLDNSVAENWAASLGHGSPGRSNEFPVSVVTCLEKPAGLTLFPAYPNPFNPSATVRYYLPERSVVSISVFDLLGREVQSLMSQSVQPEGFHSVSINGVNLPSGIYFIRLSAGSSARVSKLTLLK